MWIMGRYEILIGINWLPTPLACEVWQVVAEMEPPGRLAVSHPDSRPWRRGADGQPVHGAHRRTARRPGHRRQRASSFPTWPSAARTAASVRRIRRAQLLDCWRRVHAQVRETLDGPLALGGKVDGRAGDSQPAWPTELSADALVCLDYPFYAAGKRRSAGRAPRRAAPPTLIVRASATPGQPRGGGGLCAGADDPPALAGRGGPRPQAAEGLRPDHTSSTWRQRRGGGRLPSRAQGH